MIDATALERVGQIDIETVRRILTLLADQSNAHVKFFRCWLLKTGEYRQLIEIDGGRSHLIVGDEVCERFLCTLRVPREMRRVYVGYVRNYRSCRGRSHRDREGERVEVRQRDRCTDAATFERSIRIELESLSVDREDRTC